MGVAVGSLAVGVASGTARAVGVGSRVAIGPITISVGVGVGVGSTVSSEAESVPPQAAASIDTTPNTRSKRRKVGRGEA